ncbi:origin recognition complex, subunit 6 [Coniochaeta sp. 2T2.1]|nr:origin recognition complex, subunit 6 [Coniochaeta sp. 2T2.1]
MNRSIEQALISLIPTHNTDLPQPLLDLATSLLAQSQHKASTLKQDEEIARPYACAHLACDRLKISLNLPPISARPPVPPRIYNRLYSHLDHILPNHTPSGRTPRTRTPSSKVRDQDDFIGSRSKASFLRTTPGTERSLSAFRYPANGQAGTPSRTGRSSAKKPAAAEAAGLPPWVRPTLRYLCKAVDSTKVGPTVIAGMEAIVCPHGQKTKDKFVLGHMTSILGFLFLYVWATVGMPNGVDEARYIAAREEIVGVLEQARRIVAIKDVDDEEVAWEGWKDMERTEIDDVSGYANRHGWMESDWAQGVKDLVQREEDQAAERAGVGRGRRTPAGPVRRTDMMLQEKYDYLSERRRKVYAKWKQGILKQIVRLEREKEAAMVD